jgi:anthranilate synthase component 2/putative glutamine amidotransferase
LTTYYAEAAWGPWHRPAALVPAAYVEQVAAAGARPVLLPPTRRSPDGPASGAGEAVAALDALVLIGGADLDPGSYGQERHEQVAGVDADRDAAEDALLGAALAADLPLLAICRGLQLLNVHLGGTLHQHLPEVVGHRGHQPEPGRFDDVTVTTVAGTLAARLLGPSLDVRCSHHQAVDRLAPGLVPSALAPGPDGGPPVLEAAEVAGRRFALGVQWHPEEDEDGRLFEALVEAAR